MEPNPSCPCCNSAMEMHGDVVGGHLHYCDYCFGMLTSDRWLDTNMDTQVLRRLKTAVFNGEAAGYSCPTCEGEMVKGPVPTSVAPIEVDGCLKCGSLWFDNRELEPFLPDFEELTPQPMESTASKVTTGVARLFRIFH